MCRESFEITCVLPWTIFLTLSLIIQLSLTTWNYTGIPCFYSNRPSKFPFQCLEGSPPLFYSGLCSAVYAPVRPSLTSVCRNTVAKPPTLRLSKSWNFSPFYISPLCLSPSVAMLVFYDPFLSEFELHEERFLLGLRLGLELAKRKNQHYLCLNMYFPSHLFCRIYYDIFL